MCVCVCAHARARVRACVIARVSVFFGGIWRLGNFLASHWPSISAINSKKSDDPEVWRVACGVWVDVKL